MRKALGISDHTGKVLEASPADGLSLDRGDGIKPGQQLRVFRDKGQVTDPDTGEVLGQERIVALLNVEEVQPAFCTARLAEGSAGSIRAGDLAGLAAISHHLDPSTVRTGHPIASFRLMSVRRGPDLPRGSPSRRPPQQYALRL